MPQSGRSTTLKTLKLGQLREEKVVLRMGTSTGGAKRRSRRRSPTPPTRKTRRGLREEDTTMQKSQRKEKPLLYTLLIMALVLNSTMAFFLLANRDRLISPPAKAAAEPGVSSLSSRPSEMEKKKAISGAVSRPAGTQGRRPERRLGAVKSVTVANAPVKKEGAERKNKIVFFLSPHLYRLRRDTILVTRKDRTRIIIPKGTVVRVAGFANGDRALVVSRRGKPDGYVPRGALVDVADEKETVTSSPIRSEATGRSVSPKANLPTRVAGGPYGGSITLGPAYIYVSRTGQVNGSFSR